MSIKIYTGFYLDTPIEEVVPVLKGFKAALEPVMKERAKSAMCNQLATLCLSRLNGESDKSMLPASCSKSDEEYLKYLFCTEKRFLGWAAKLVDVWANVSESPLSPATDYSEDCCVLGKVILFPCEKRTYGISRGPFGFTNAFEALPQVHDFCYWNNTDKPPAVSDADWAAREQIWNNLLPSFWSEDDGLSYTLFTARRFDFIAPEAEAMDAWLAENRTHLTAQRMGFLLREKISEATPQGELSGISYILKLHDLALMEARHKTSRSAWASSKAEKEVPASYDDILALLS